MGRSSPRVALCIMAKAPEPGQVKTRLGPPLSTEEATRLYRAFLLDKIAQVRAVRSVEPAIAYAPDDASSVFETLTPGFRLFPQGSGDLTARIVSVLSQLFRNGADGVILTDSDTPTLPVECLTGAMERLAAGADDLVLGPSEDGGYYLIGLRRVHRALFEGMPWSTPAILAETLGRPSALGLRVALLAPWYDVDTGSDLTPLVAELDGSGNDAPPRHTRRLLREAGRIFVSGGRI